MEWEVVQDEQFATWLLGQATGVQDAVARGVAVLVHEGPALGRPLVDSVKESRHQNMKELRLQVGGRPWRVFFAFDPIRRAVLLVGGCKRNDKRFYKRNIRIADERFDRHLAAMSDPE